MNKSTPMLALALAASLLWAYLVSHPTGNKGGTSPASAKIWDVPLRDVSRLTYNNGKTQVVIQADWSEGGETPYLWVETQVPSPQPKKRKIPQKIPPKIPKSKADPGESDKDTDRDAVSGEAVTGETLVKTAFKGNAAALEALKYFAGATALRSLGALENLEGGEFGFPGDNHNLKVGSAGQHPALRLDVGRNSYGNSNRYVHSNRDGHVYLMRNSEFRKLSQAQRSMLDRELLGLKPEDIARIDLRLRKLERSFWRMEKGAWSDRPDNQDGNPQPTVEAMAAFSTSVHRLRVLKYLGDPEEVLPELGNPMLELRLYGSPDEADPAWLKLYQGKGVNAVGVSSFTRKAVSLNRKLVDSMIAQARKLVRGA
jgi:hypothetical protein